MNRVHNNGCYLLGIDLGTSTLKIGIFDINGKEILLLDEEYQLDYPGENMVENDVEKYWDRITGLLRRAARSIDTSRITSLSISSQAETIVPVNRQGKPLSRAAVTSFDAVCICLRSLANRVAPMAMPSKRTARNATPMRPSFPGGAGLTPHNCLSSSSWSR